jgi:hypothetical protein
LKLISYISPRYSSVCEELQLLGWSGGRERSDSGVPDFFFPGLVRGVYPLQLGQDMDVDAHFGELLAGMKQKNLILSTTSWMTHE